MDSSSQLSQGLTVPNSELSCAVLALQFRLTSLRTFLPLLPSGPCFETLVFRYCSGELLITLQSLSF